MTSLFDGVAGLLSDVFGGPVVWISADHGEIPVQSIFRREPIEVDQGAGEPVLIMGPTWRVPTGVLPRAPKRDDRIRTTDGKLWKITAVQDSASPASDRFHVCELELIQ